MEGLGDDSGECTVLRDYALSVVIVILYSAEVLASSGFVRQFSLRLWSFSSGSTSLHLVFMFMPMYS